MKTAGRVVLWSLAVLGTLVVVVTATPLVYWWATWLAGPWDDPNGEVLIVLGGSILDNGMIGGSSYWRAIYGAQVYQEGGFQQVVISGGGADKVAVAEPIRQFIECLGVPPGVIRVETRSNNTHENALYTRQLLAGVAGRKVLVTSDFHMFRARRAFAKVGMAVLPRPYPDVRKRGAYWRARWTCFLDLTEETVKIVYYYVRGWI